MRVSSVVGLLGALVLTGVLGCGSPATEPVKINKPLPRGRIPEAPQPPPSKN